MLKGLAVLVLVAAGWIAALWFVVAPDFAQWPLPQLVAMHALPPLGVSGFWLGGRRWLRSRAERRVVEAEAAAADERSADADAARKQAAGEAARRRFGCDCRAVAMVQVVGGEEETPLAENSASVYFSPFESSEAGGAGETSLVAHLSSGVQEALDAIYERSPAAASLPVYVLPPRRARVDEFVAMVRAAQGALVGGDCAPSGTVKEVARVCQLAQEGHVLDELIALFERTPGLAIVVIGSDSPWLHARSNGDEDAAPECGDPGQGVFALLLTHPELANEDSGIQPEKTAALLSLPVLARLHRPANGTVADGRKRANDLARVIGGLMAEARRNAGSADPVAAGDGGGVQGTEKQEGDPIFGWLVHNAGTPANCGARMAGIGVALLNHGIELDPLDEATNVSTAAGDLGDARSVGMLALAVAKAASTKSNALCVEFRGDKALSLFLARAPESGEAADAMA